MAHLIVLNSVLRVLSIDPLGFTTFYNKEIIILKRQTFIL